VSRKTVQPREAGTSIPDAKAEQSIVEVCNERSVFTAPLAARVADESALRRALASARVRRSPPAHERREPATDGTLLGRDLDFHQVVSAMAVSRLVTLTGPPGIGKTRLAEAVAEAERANGQVTAAYLAALAEPELILPALADALAARQAAGGTLRDVVIAALCRSSLLLLDNCEHLPAISSTVDDLLRSCPTLRVLATSRAALGVPGEHNHVLGPLDLDAAAALLERTAQRLSREFKVTDDNRQAVVELCARLDRLPLAIELAAARLRVLSPRAVIEHLDRRLELLTARDATVGDRHRSLRAALGWSVDFLDEDVQRTFRSLGAFAGSFDVAGVIAVTAEDGIAVMDQLDVLLDQNLVHLARPAAEPRFALLETVRSFAVDQLAAAGDLEAVRRRFADHCRHLAAVHAGRLHGPEQLSAVRALDLERENLRAALAWLAESDAPAGLQLANTLAPYWDAKSALTEGRDWLARTINADGVSWVDVGTASTWAAYLAALQGDLAEAERLATAALAIWDEHDAEQGRGYARLMLGFVAMEHGALADGERQFTASLEALDAADDRWGRARPLNNLAEIARMQGDLDRAGRLHAEALAIVRELGDLGSQPNILCGLGHVHVLLGEPAAAREVAREAVEISELLGNRLGTATALGLLGLARFDDDPRRAARLLGAADALRTALGSPAEARDRILLDGALAEGAARAGDAFLQDWRAGATTPLDDIVQEALGSPR
jgi:predicted ATPase